MLPSFDEIRRRPGCRQLVVPVPSRTAAANASLKLAAAPRAPRHSASASASRVGAGATTGRRVRRRAATARAEQQPSSPSRSGWAGSATARRRGLRLDRPAAGPLGAAGSRVVASSTTTSRLVARLVARDLVRAQPLPGHDARRGLQSRPGHLDRAFAHRHRQRVGARDPSPPRTSSRSRECGNARRGSPSACCAR